MQIINSVYDFNEQIIKAPANPPLAPLSQERRDWALKAFREEIEEFEEAHAKEDFIVQVDSLLDLVYFAVGRLQEMGVTREQAIDCFMAIHNANMTKRRGAQEKRGGQELDAIKPEGWVPPEEKIGHILFGEA